ncbi:mitochondrial calcium uniporter regulator 1 [Nerophis lumbriciformis]|uniref:mitochondrial calcium uniporter regulator 1 n=1 Tax=Nerophis lumbriciformis TaxID=546530 RepID=UPI002ADFF9F4|nr:mitochondrial calcium uniporter regulator 1-like [Nerophis lumbriciformis]
MILKQCHMRFRVFALKHNGKRFKIQDRVNFCCCRSSNFWTTVRSCTCVCCSSSLMTSSSDSHLEKRQFGLRAMHLSAREHTSVSGIQLEVKSDVPKGRKLFFDTHAVVRLFEENDFSTQQAEVLVQVLVKMTNSNMDTIYSDMVTKGQQEIMLQRVMSQIAALKKDMIILEKSEFSTLLAENEKLKIELWQLKVQLADVMNKIRSDTFLDMNLEKSRVKELKVDHERKLLETRTDILEMTAEQDRHLTQTNMKIDTEVAGLKTMLESHKLDTIKYLAGSVFTCLTVVLGFYRIWM